MMPKSYLKTKKSESKLFANGPGGLKSAQIKVYLETQTSDENVFQNFRLVTSDVRLLQYFTDDKFLGYHILEREMAKYYAGDGEVIIYRKKVYYNNLITVMFEKLKKNANTSSEYMDVQFTVEAPVPATLGCKDCEHFRKKYRQCLYYQQMGIKLKKNCADFKQKEK
jgi:hypothetical protein